MYNSVMAATGEALMQAAGALLAPGNASQLEYDGDADEFGQYVCETMAGFGTSHLHTLAPDKKILFLQQACPLRPACLTEYDGCRVKRSTNRAASRDTCLPMDRFRCSLAAAAPQAGCFAISEAEAAADAEAHLDAHRALLSITQ